jgi:hypothetical protein
MVVQEIHYVAGLKDDVMLAIDRVINWGLENRHEAVIKVVVPFSPPFQVDLAVLVINSCKNHPHSFNEWAESVSVESQVLFVRLRHRILAVHNIDRVQCH